MLKKCNKCGFQQDEFLNLGGRNYCKSCNSVVNVNSNQIMVQEEKTAHQLRLALGNLRFTLKALEKYFERAHGNNYPSFRSQLYERKAEDDNYPLENSREQFLTQLLIMRGVCKGEPEFFRNEIKKEFHKWFSATGINANNCPDEIKHFLFEINEVLEDRGEKIVEENEVRIKNMKFDPKGVIGLFGALQEPMNKAREEKKNYEGKKWNELGNENRFNVSDEQGEKGLGVFQQIHREIASKQSEFSFYQSQVVGSAMDDEFQNPRRTLINNVKQNPWQWRIEELIISVSGHNQLNREWMLIRYDAKIEHNFGGLIPDPGKLFSKHVFSESEWGEIQQALNSQTSTSTQYYQKSQSVSDKINNPTTPNSNNGGLGTITIIGGILVLASFRNIRNS